MTLDIGQKQNKNKRMVTEMDTEKHIKKPKRLKPFQQTVLRFMATVNQPTAQKVADNYGISLRTAKRHIAFLLINNYIARHGNNRSGGYKILNTEDTGHEQ